MWAKQKNSLDNTILTHVHYEGWFVTHTTQIWRNLRRLVKKKRKDSVIWDRPLSVIRYRPFYEDSMILHTAGIDYIISLPISL